MADSPEASSSSPLQLNNRAVAEGTTVNGSERPHRLSPAQQRQLEADSHPDSPSSRSASPRRPRKPSTPPDFLSEGDFPSLGSSTPKPPLKPVGSWGAKRSPAPVTSSPTSNGVNGRASSTANSSRASTPAPAHRVPVIPRAKNLHSPTVTEQVRFAKYQLQNPNAKDFAAVCDRIAKFTGVDRIDVTRMKVSEVVNFSITGKPENVVKAKNRLQNEVGIKRIEKISAPASVLPFIIGKKGVILKNIQDASGANVKVPKRDSENASVVAEEEGEEELVDITIEGIDAAVYKAREEIMKIVDERTSKKTEKLLDIPPDFFLLIAGPNDANIQEWEGDVDRDIKIRIPHPHHSVSDDHITLIGHKDLVAEVREKIETKYKQLRASTTAATIDVPRAQHRFLIGDRGEGIKNLFAETGCAVIVPPLRVDAGDRIQVRAERSKLGVGLVKILERAAEVTLTTVDLLSFTGKDEEGILHARNFFRYAKRQNLFARLVPFDTVNLSIPKTFAVMADNPSMMFEIDGKDATQVHNVENALHALIRSKPRNRFTTIEVDPCLHGVLIGKKGQGLQFIKEQFDVFCLFQSEEDADPEILLVYEGHADPTSSLEAAKEYMQTHASTTSDIDEHTLNIPRKYHKIIVGPNGTTLNALIGDQSDRLSGTRVHVWVGGKSRDPDKQDDVVVVRGPTQEVLRVIKNIQEHVAEAKHTEFITSHVEEFTIPLEYSKNIIGRGGKRIQELRERFGVSIKVDEGKVHVQGVKKNGEEAKKSILQIVAELKDDTIQRLPVKNEHHGHLIGEKGSNVRRLQERYAVRIHFPKREDEEDRNSLPEEERPRGLDEIVVRGPSKGVKSAIEELNALLEYRIQLLEDRQQRSHTAEIEILARGRQRLLRNSNGIVPLLRHDPGHVRIDVPSRVEGESDDTMIKIRVEGTQAFVKRAIKEIGSLRDEVNGETTRTLTIDQRLHKSLIGPGGRALQKLIIDAGGPEDRSIQARMVKFPRQGDESDKIVLTGPPAVVDKIVEKFLEFAARETIEVDVPTDKLSRIIGTGGKKRMELEAEYDVIIYVPPVNRGAARGIEKVKVTGRPEQNERAKKAIYDIVKTGDGVTVQVPKGLHHRVSNDGRTKNHLRQRFSVYVSHDGVEIPPAASLPVNGTLGRIDDEEEMFSWHVIEDPSDSHETIPWKLRGSSDVNLQKAKEYLDNLIVSIRDQGNCTGYLGVPPEHHHLVIGKGGQHIEMVRGETGCTVDVPRRGEGSDTIIIRGSRDGVERAKNLIVETVEDGQHRSNGSSPLRRR